MIFMDEKLMILFYSIANSFLQPGEDDRQVPHHLYFHFYNRLTALPRTTYSTAIRTITIFIGTIDWSFGQGITLSPARLLMNNRV